MRAMTTGALTAALLSAALVGTAKADYVPPFKGNDTGGIIAYALVHETNVKALAADHCAQYGKVVKLTGVQPVYGGYLSFACLWPRAGRYAQPLRVRY